MPNLGILKKLLEWFGLNPASPVVPTTTPSAARPEPETTMPVGMPESSVCGVPDAVTQAIASEGANPQRDLNLPTTDLGDKANTSGDRAQGQAECGLEAAGGNSAEQHQRAAMDLQLPSREQRRQEALNSLKSTLKMEADGLPLRSDSAEEDKKTEGEAIEAGGDAQPEPVETKSPKFKLKSLSAPEGEHYHSPDEGGSLRDETLHAIRNLIQAPAMGWLAENLVQIMRKSEVDLDEVVAAISKDPAISTRILRMANSPAVASFERVTDLKTAVSLLGIQRVRLTAQALITLQETGRIVEGFNWRHLWIHSFACALLAGEIPRRLHLTVHADCYLAGLLHDLGKILLSHLNPKKYKLMLMEAVCDGTPLHQLELQHFGVTHDEAGAEFARLNKLPPQVIAAIETHATPQQADEESAVLSACISVANYLAKIHGLGFSGSPLSEMEEELGETEGWRILAAAAVRPPSANDFHLQLRPFIADLKQELHSWARGKH